VRSELDELEQNAEPTMVQQTATEKNHLLSNRKDQRKSQREQKRNNYFNLQRKTIGGQNRATANKSRKPISNKYQNRGRKNQMQKYGRRNQASNF
jgi:hypothetical protein